MSDLDTLYTKEATTPAVAQTTTPGSQDAFAKYNLPAPQVSPNELPVKDDRPFSQKMLTQAYHAFNVAMGTSTGGISWERDPQFAPFMESLGRSITDIGTHSIPQLMAKAQEYFGNEKKGFSNLITKEINQDDADRLKTLQQKYPGLENKDAINEGLEIGPTLPLLAVASASPILSAGKYAAPAFGAIQGALQYDPTNQNKFRQTATGLLMGTGIGISANKLNNASEMLNTPYYEEATNLEKQLGTGDILTTAQKSQNPELMSIAQQKGIYTSELTNAQTKAAYTSMQNAIDKMNASPIPKPELVQRAKVAIDDGINSIQTAASNQWKADSAQLHQLTNGEAVIPQDAVKQAYTDLKNQYTSGQFVNSPLGKKVSAEVDNYLANAPSSLTVKDFNNNMTLINKTANGKSVLPTLSTLPSEAQQDAAQAIRKAMFDDWNAGVQSGTISNETKQLMTSMRDNYGTQMDKINSLRASALGKLLGSSDGLVPEKFLQKFSTMSPDQIKFAIDQMTQLDPAVTQNVKASILSNALESSRIPNASPGQYPFDTNKFLKTIPQADKLQALLSPDELNNVQQSLRFTQFLQKSPNVSNTLEGMNNNISETLQQIAGSEQKGGPLSARLFDYLRDKTNLTNLMLNPSTANIIKAIGSNQLPAAQVAVALSTLTNNALEPHNPKNYRTQVNGQSH